MSNWLDKNLTPPIDEDHEYVLRCKGGDTGAFEVLVEKYQKRMFSMAYRLLGDYDEASEAVQEAFLASYRGIGKFREEARFSTWLYTITVNCARNRMKEAARRSFREVGEITGQKQEVADSRPNPVDCPGGPVLDEIERREIQRTVQASIDTLEPEFKEVLVLRDIQGFSYEEMADILKVPDGTVKSRLFRAREMLRGRLRKAWRDL